jgi:hypothetical protein
MRFLNHIENNSHAKAQSRKEEINHFPLRLCALA